MRWSRIAIALGLIAATASYVFVAKWMLSTILPYRFDGLFFVSVAKDNHQAGRTVLTLKFRSPDNLRQVLQARGETYVIASYQLCDSGIRVSSSPVLHNAISINDQPSQVCGSTNGGPLNCWMNNDNPAVRAEVAHRDDPGPYEYQARFFYEDYCAKEGPHSCDRYAPLPVPPREDICMKIVDTSIYSPHLRSNVVRIPKEDVAKAMATRKP